jgi:DNA-binding NarL/FixJ family response regulator
VLFGGLRAGDGLGIASRAGFDGALPRDSDEGPSDRAGRQRSTQQWPEAAVGIVAGLRSGSRPLGRVPSDYVSTETSRVWDRVLERRRAVALAAHFREVEGLSIAQIAERLGRSPATVKAYFYDPS